MNYSDFLKEAAQGRIHPVYFFHGDERLLLEAAISKLKEIIVPGGAGDLNYQPFSGSGTRAQEVITVCQTFPVFADRRLVIVRDLEGLSGSEALLSYLDNPSPSTCLILVAGKVDQRKKLFSVLKSKTAEVVFSRLNDRQITGWIRDLCRSRKMILSPQAVEHLKDRAGSDLFHIQNEIEKISLASAGTEPLEPEDIETLLTGQASVSAFAWLDAVRSGDRERALCLLGTLLDSGEYPLALLGLLTSNFRRRLQGGGPPPVKGKTTGAGKNSRRWSRAFNLCLEADSRLKGSRLPARLILEDLVLDLCGTNPAGPPNGSRGI